MGNKIKCIVFVILLISVMLFTNAPTTATSSTFIIDGKPIVAYASNSTWEEMYFNTTEVALHLVVTGKSNTVGFIHLWMNKTFIDVLANKSITLDDLKILGNVTLALISWNATIYNTTYPIHDPTGNTTITVIELYMLYRHSTRNIIISFGAESQNATRDYTPTYLEAFLVAFAVSVVLPLLIIYVLGKHKRRVKK